MDIKAISLPLPSNEYDSIDQQVTRRITEQAIETISSRLNSIEKLDSNQLSNAIRKKQFLLMGATEQASKLTTTAEIADGAVTSAKLDTNITVSGTLDSTGKLTADAGIDVDNFNIDGTTIALSSGDMTLDSAGDIILDADGGNIRFKDAETTHYHFSNGGNSLGHTFFADSGSNEGSMDFTFQTDGSAAGHSITNIIMRQGSGDGGSRKGEMLFQVSDNGAPATALTIANNGVVSGNLNDTSDVALKENITDLGSATATLKQLQPRTFDWKQASKGTGVAGFVAQEVASVIPKAVVGNDYSEADKNTGKAINTTSILAYAVKTIQELEARIKILEDA